MVLHRKGRMSKMQKINNALKRATNLQEVYEILDCSEFNLTSSEACVIAQDWHKMQQILKVHGKGAYAAVQVVA